MVHYPSTIASCEPPLVSCTCPSSLLSTYQLYKYQPKRSLNKLSLSWRGRRQSDEERGRVYGDTVGIVWSLRPGWRGNVRQGILAVLPRLLSIVIDVWVPDSHREALARLPGDVDPLGAALGSRGGDGAVEQVRARIGSQARYRVGSRTAAHRASRAGAHEGKAVPLDPRRCRTRRCRTCGSGTLVTPFVVLVNARELTELSWK